MNMNGILISVLKYFEEMGVVWAPGVLFGIELKERALILSVGVEGSMFSKYVLAHFENDEILNKTLSKAGNYWRVIKPEMKFLISTGSFSKYSERVKPSEEKHDPEESLEGDFKQDFESYKEFVEVTSKVKSEVVQHLLKEWHSDKGHKAHSGFLNRLEYRKEELHPLELVRDWGIFVKAHNVPEEGRITAPYRTLSSLAGKARSNIYKEMKRIKTSFDQLKTEMGVTTNRIQTKSLIVT